MVLVLHELDEFLRCALLSWEEGRDRREGRRVEEGGRVR